VFQELFNAQYRKNYGRTIPKLSVEALTWTLVLSSKPLPEPAPPPMPKLSGPPQVEGTKQVFDAECGGFLTASVFRRDALRPGSTFAGPAIVIEEQTTTYLPDGFKGSVSAHGHLILQRARA
jgi:N-methylhydantoinase A